MTMNLPQTAVSPELEIVIMSNKYKIKTPEEIGCDGECSWGWAGESCYPCKNCLGVKKGDGNFIKAMEGVGTPFDHAMYFIHDNEYFLCDKLGEKVWIRAKD